MGGEVECPRFEGAVTQIEHLFGIVHRAVDHRPVVVVRSFVAHLAVAGPALGIVIAFAAIARAAAAVVDGDRRLRAPAQQLPHRLPAHLPQDIPQGQVDGRNCPQFRTARAEVGGAFVEEAPVAFDGQRVRAQQPPRHPIVDHRRHGMWHIVGFAAADDARVGVDAQQQQPRHDLRHGNGFDLGDF